MSVLQFFDRMWNFAEHEAVMNDALRQWVNDRLFPARLQIRDNGKLGKWPAELFAELGELGINGLLYPSIYGGSGVIEEEGWATAYRMFTLASREINQASRSFGTMLGANFELFGEVVHSGGSDKQKELILPRLCSGKIIGGFAMTPRGSGGTNVASMEDKAVPIPGGWKLYAKKKWITNAPLCDYVVVLVKEEGSGQFMAFLVDTKRPGVSMGSPERKVSIPGSITAAVDCEGVEVSEDDLIGEPGEGLRIFLNVLGRCRALVQTQALAIQERALQIAIDHAATYKAGGRPLTHHGHIRQKIATMFIMAQQAHASVISAVDQFGRSQNRDQDIYPAILTTGAKIAASDDALQACILAQEILASDFQDEDGELRSLTDDASVIKTYEGENNAMREAMIFNQVFPLMTSSS